MTTVLGLAVAPVVSARLGHPLTTGTSLAFAGVCGGYGVLPDFDHPHATLAHVFGPVTKAIATFIHGVSGGHRKGTHTVWCAAGVVGLVTWLSHRFGDRAEIPLVFAGFYLLAMILRLAPHPSSGRAELLYVCEAAGATSVCYFLLPGWWWLPWAVVAASSAIFSVTF